MTPEDLALRSRHPSAEKALAEVLWRFASVRPHAEHLPGECDTCDWSRHLANVDAWAVLTELRKHPDVAAVVLALGGIWAGIDVAKGSDSTITLGGDL